MAAQVALPVDAAQPPAVRLRRAMPEKHRSEESLTKAVAESQKLELAVHQQLSEAEPEPELRRAELNLHRAVRLAQMAERRLAKAGLSRKVEQRRD